MGALKVNGDREEFKADLESALRDTELTDNAKNNIRYQVTTNLLHSKPPIDLTEEERQALKEIKKRRRYYHTTRRQRTGDCCHGSFRLH